MSRQRYSRSSTNERDYYHPLLLLRTTQLALALKGTRPTPEQVVLTGRQVSAVSAGLAVVALAFAAARLNGPLASLMVAAIVGTCPLLFGLAHYMKEDVIFVLALSVFFLSMVFFDQRNSYVNVAAMGVAAGLVVSAKYIGVIVLPLAIITLVRRLPLRRRALGMLILATCALTVFALAGIDTLEMRRVAAGLRLEVMHVASTSSHHGGFTWPITSAFYVKSLIQSTSITLLACYVIAIHLSLSRQWSMSQVIIILFPLFLLFIIQMSPVKIVRYQLPVLICCGFGAACALSNLVKGWKIVDEDLPRA